MAIVYTAEGTAIDSLAVATEDAILTVVARLDFLSADSLAWLAQRCTLHADECAKTDRPEMSTVLTALVVAIQKAKPL